MNTVDKALTFAVKAHAGQFRKDVAIPFVVHPISVMHQLMRWGIHDEAVLAAALLHDVVEDTSYSIRDIWDEFGERIAKLVEEVTRTDDPTQTDKDEYLNSFEQKSIEAGIIKMADRVDNALDYYAAGKHRYAHKYFWRAEAVFSLLDSRSKDIIAAFEDGDDIYQNIICTVKITQKILEGYNYGAF